MIYYFITIWWYLYSLTMLLPIFPFTFINRLISKSINPETLSFVILIKSFIFSSIRPWKLTQTIHLVLFSVSIVRSFIFPFKYTLKLLNVKNQFEYFSIKLIIDPLSFIRRTIIPIKFSITLFYSFIKLPFKDRLILKYFLSLTML